MAMTSQDGERGDVATQVALRSSQQREGIMAAIPIGDEGNNNSNCTDGAQNSSQDGPTGTIAGFDAFTTRVSSRHEHGVALTGRDSDRGAAQEGTILASRRFNTHNLR